jgi:preprotein translocase SecE subunit
VARNRKRAKERRARQPQPIASARNGDDANPMAHASPDAELAEAQLALGRPDLALGADAGADDDAAQEDLDEFEAEVEASGAGGGRGDRPTDDEFDDGDGAGGEGPRLEPSAPLPAPRPHIGGRLVNFVQGSWRELQRVQWPDRRQVMQATGVVIGFVIVAGVFLGVSDFLAGKLMDYILK